jgi:putative glycosyltransferase (TIGR04372 family)
MTLLRKISRQLWQAKNMGIGHVWAKVIRRMAGGASTPNPSETALRIHAARSTEQTSLIEREIRKLSSEMREAFEEGRYSDYLRLGNESGSLRDELARRWGMDPAERRVIGSSFLGPLGHLSFLDMYVKGATLRQMDQRFTNVLAEKSKVANRSYLQLWEKHLEVRKITLQEWVDVDLVEWPICERADFVRTVGGYENSMSFWDRVNRDWENETRDPLLELDSGLLDRGTSVLRKMGLKESDWYVCFHVREGDHRVTYRGPNSDVSTYSLAMDEVVKRGGVAIRMGNTDMTAIKEKPGIVDYAHSVRRADWMDVFLWATCRFFVGTGSGPIHVPGTFGVPVLMTNTSAIGMFPSYSVGSKMITKHFHDQETGRELALAEALDRRVGWNWSADFSKQGVTMRDNTPEELRDAVVDMFGGDHSLTKSQIAMNEQRASSGSLITTPFAPTFAETMAMR